MRVEIDFPYLQSKDTLRGRREYLTGVFKEGPKWVNKRFFDVDPVRSHQGIRPLKRLGNLIRGVFRQVVLPFPITYTNKKSRKLTQKQVISIEEFILGSSKPESFFSALRVGVNQYAGYFAGILIALAGIAVPLIVSSIASFGTVPLVLCSVGAAYLLYATIRAQRKQALTTGYLKLKRAILRKKHTYKEKLLVKMYTLVTLLERVKESVQKYPEEAKEIILKTLKDQISAYGYTGDEKYLVLLLSKVVNDEIKKFEADISSDDIEEGELLDKLDELISNLEKIDIRAELERLGLNSELEQEIDCPIESINNLQNVHTQTPGYDRLSLQPKRRYNRHVSYETTPPSLVGSSGSSDEMLSDDIVGNATLSNQEEKIFNEDFYNNNEELSRFVASTRRGGRRENGGKNGATENQSTYEEAVPLAIEIGNGGNKSAQEGKTKKNDAKEKTPSKSKFDELMCFKRVIKTEMDTLMKSGNCDEASTLNSVVQRINLKKCDGRPLAYVKKLIEDADLSEQLKENLNSNLEKTPKVNLCTPLNGHSHMNGHSHNRIPLGDSNRRISNGNRRKKPKQGSRRCIPGKV